MATRLPGYILTDCNLYIGSGVGSRLGQASEMTLPVLSKSFEDFRNAGMVKPREIPLGYEATTASFKETAYDPKVLAIFGYRNLSVIVYGALRSEDGSDHSARFEMICDAKAVDAGSWVGGDKAETSYELAVHRGKLFVDEIEIYSFDDFDVSVMGKSLNPGRRQALRLD